MKLSHAGRAIMRWAPMERAVSWLIASYIALVYYTTRWQLIGFDERERLIDSGERFVVAAWHNRLAMVPYTYDRKRCRLAALTSAHRDGRMVRHVYERFGILSIGVRSSDVDLGAARQILAAARGGAFVGVAADGPRGPRMRVKPSVVSLARLCSGRVTLMTYAVKRRIVLRSWDRFNIPLPFNRGVFIWSAGLVVPEDPHDLDAIAAWCADLERALTRQTDRADAMMGHEPIEPAPADEAPRSAKHRRADAPH